MAENVWAGYASPFALLVHYLESRRREATQFERVVYAGRDSVNRLYDTWRAGSIWHRFGWTCLKGLNVASTLDAISISVTKDSFRPDRAEEALSGAGEELLWLLWWISGGFDIMKARAAREPCEDDARSVGVPSARRLWAFFGVFF
ncbi:hypothetical protein Taro_033736 [Colocasia esculenta]|uniref:Uncharacterized protein n=1 Tax=Colocasia esculenta TaxID=4460 RepID=A0A843W2A2_COLES|nr:hypothetical protein [Colocasia esculenta]